MNQAAIQKPKSSVVEGKRQKQIDSSPIASTSYDQNIILSHSLNREEIDEDYEPGRYPTIVYSLLEIP